LVVAYAKAVACELPRTRGVPLPHWSLAELRAELLASGLVSEVSTTTLWRWLADDPIRPWRHRSWIFPRDPAFAAKAGVVLDLYQRVFQAAELSEDEYEQTAVPFAWRYTRADLDRLIRRLDEPAQPIKAA
jgi:hypothetical protein